MVILIDLDGTLTNTSDAKFKPYKDGLQNIKTEDIPFFAGAKDFIKNIIRNEHQAVIISDSHPQYVNKIATILNLPAVCLTDKPNPEKTLAYLNSQESLKPLLQNKDNFIIIGDTWLDIELGRRLNFRTVLTKFYKTSNIEERDGIGQGWKPLKTGPTFYTKSFEELEKIIENPNAHLLALEAIFQKENSGNMVKFKYQKSNRGFVAFRCLARQEDGECDRFARADKYYQIDNPNRSPQFVIQLAKGLNNYLTRVANFPEYQWDLITYVSDKKTTSPPNKMKEIFDLVDSPFEKIKLFEWSDKVDGSLRDRPNYKLRKEFISKYLYTVEGNDLNGKNIIIIDDQFTSSATAYEITHQLRKRGAKNILFVALFYLILPIESKNCTKTVNGILCGKPMKIKIKKSDGHKFYSCTPPKYGGEGCGHIENILA